MYSHEWSDVNVVIQLYLLLHAQFVTTETSFSLSLSLSLSLSPPSPSPLSP